MPTHGKAAYLALWTYWKIKLFLLQRCDLFLLQTGASGTKTAMRWMGNGYTFYMHAI